MKKKLLIATDGSIHSKQALTYTAAFMSGGAEWQCTVFNVQPIMSQYLVEEAKTDAAVRTSLKKMSEQYQAESMATLNKGLDILLNQGIDKTDIELVSQERVLGLAKDILEYGRQNDYDAIVTGRRGLTRAQKLFMGSVTAKLVEFSDGQTVWVVDGDITPRHFLIAVDVMAPWGRLLDRLSSLLAGMPRLHLTFYHVVQESWVEQLGTMSPETYDMAAKLARHEQEMSERFRQEATQRMISAGIDGRHIQMLTPTKTAKIGKMIINEAEIGGYDTVVTCRSGSGRAYYSGSTSRYVADRLTDHALWIV